VAVIVCTRDRADELGPALVAVAATLRPIDELIVVDSASIDGNGVAEIANERAHTWCAADSPG